ncbi:FAD-binding oxidoreductase (plasmid) [Rhodobacteraceae bacterium M382]|nr:FAD-binding oxidoreductase [Rhodobacteraceae bacterium M382]
MKRIYEPMAYQNRPIRDRFWDDTVPKQRPEYPELTGEVVAEFAVIGGGYTGLSAALHLAEAGADVVLVDAETPGWGASGRNGGLVSVGGSKVEDDYIIRRFGQTDAQQYFEAERGGVDLVDGYLNRFELDVDRHSDGYTSVAHTPAAISGLRAYGESYSARYGLPYRFVPKGEMAEQGMDSPDFYAAGHLPIGFALNPMKFVLGLTRAVKAAGVRMFSNTPVSAVHRDGAHVLTTPQGQVRANKLLIATNGYSSDDVPGAMANRYLPVQSNILVSRPLSDQEIAAQGWSSRQMFVDTRTLLHYFRLLPDNRMMLGLRGSVRVSEAHLTRTRAIARADFDRMFPAWAHVETPYFWSGLICMTRDLLPFAGALPGADNMWGAFGYHGNGVTMANYSGALIADLALGRRELPHPDLMQRRLRRFELGPFRRWSLPPAFAWYRMQDNRLN